MLDSNTTVDPEAQAVRRQLERALSSANFIRSERLSRFLRFVVERHLEGRDDELKESVIALEVFRNRDYDPKQDSIVRTEAGRLRARLAEYYAGEGVRDPVIIELPKGCYVPVLRLPGAGLKPAPTAETVPPPAAAARPRALPWALVALLAAIALVLALVHFREAPPEQRVIKLTLNPPEKTTFGAIAVSSDGRRVAFTARDASAKTQLWVRSLDALAAQPLAGTEGASFPFWSPDSRSVGFFAESKLKKVEASGGSPQTLANAGADRGGAWSRDGVIVFAPNTSSPLLQVPVAGGEPKPATQLDASRQETSHRWPQFLPAAAASCISSGAASRNTRAFTWAHLIPRERRACWRRITAPPMPGRLPGRAICCSCGKGCCGPNSSIQAGSS